MFLSAVQKAGFIHDNLRFKADFFLTLILHFFVNFKMDQRYFRKVQTLADVLLTVKNNLKM